MFSIYLQKFGVDTAENEPSEIHKIDQNWFSSDNKQRALYMYVPSSQPPIPPDSRKFRTGRPCKFFVVLGLIAGCAQPLQN